MTNKEKYIQLSANENYAAKINLFAHPFWLNEVAENWDVCLFTKNEKIIAALPYCWKGNLITKRIYLPDLSFYQSVIFFENIPEKNKIMQELIKQLPKTIKTYFKFLPEYIDLNLSKLNYQKEDYSTYIIHKNQKDFSFTTNHKRNIQKGLKYNYVIKESKIIESSFSILTSTFSRQQLKSKINFKDFKELNVLTKKHQCGKTLDCFDVDNNLLASAFILEDKQCVYYLMGGYSVNDKNSGAMTFLLNHIIQYSQQQYKDFNFCGSSRKSIANYFEGFGATKTTVAIWKKSIL